MSKEKKVEKGRYWEEIHKKYDAVEQFKKLSPFIQLARLYKYFRERGNRRFFLQSILKYGLEDLWLKDCRLT